MDLVGTARNPVPAGATPGMLNSFDGTRLRTAHWPAGTGKRKGTVCVFGGRTEFIEKYFETIGDLQRRGFAVAAMDWRGQGGSERKLKNPRKGHVDDFVEFENDLAYFMSDVVLPDCPPPYYALAHSMGGNILLRAARRRDCWFDRMVLTSPMLQLAEFPLPLSLARPTAETAVFLGLGDLHVPGGKRAVWDSGAFAGNPLTSDERRFARNREILEVAPALGLGSPTIGWMRAAFDSMKLVTAHQFPPSVHVPVLMLAAGKDRVVSGKAIEELAVLLKAGSHLVIAGARHEILQEQDEMREQALSAFDAFVPGGS